MPRAPLHHLYCVHCGTLNNAGSVLLEGVPPCSYCGRPPVDLRSALGALGMLRDTFAFCAQCRTVTHGDYCFVCGSEVAR